MIAGLVARARSLWRGVRRGRDVNAEMDAEFRAHIELRTDDLVRAGMAPADAERRARMEFGIPDRYREQARAARGLRVVDQFHVSLLDLTLGWRMLVKYPVITVVGGLAMAFAIWMGAGTFEIVTQVINPTIPLPGGDRLVALGNRDVATNRLEHKSLHDFVAWRGQLTTVQELGAYRTLRRNLIPADGTAEPVEVAEMSTSGFQLARTPALLGRTLVAADERPDAPPVLVLGYDVWRTRFAADPAVVGRTMRLGHAVHTVVGVMPERFAFPVRHNLWVPLRLDPLAHGRREGPSIRMFGRLAPGVTLGEARAELATIGRHSAVEFRDTHEHLRPEVGPYARSVIGVAGLSSLAVMSVNLPLLMLLVLVCSNVALLMFARAATRESEIIVRNALGATRGRIVAQLFAEALVLGGVAAAVGLAGAGYGLRWLMRVVEAEIMNGVPLPFWFQGRLSATTLLYTAVLTVLAALIAGVLPALKVTRGLGTRLRQASAGGGGLRFGGIWTAVIVAQVAVTVAFPMSAFMTRRDADRIASQDVGVATEDYLTLRLEMDREPPPGAPADTSTAAFDARFRATFQELTRRLARDPAVVGVTFGDRLPRMYHPYRLVEVDEGGSAPLHPQWPAYRISSANVDARFFDVVGAPIQAGRGFHPGDLTEGSRSVIVNQSFVKLVLGGRNPIGRRVRYVHYEEWSSDARMEPGPWHEIVGVVPDLGMAVGADVGTASNSGTKPGEVPRGDPKIAGFYHPAPPGGVYPAQLAVHVRGDPMALAPRLRAMAAATDPTLRLYDLSTLYDASKSEVDFLDFWFRILVGVSAVALMLSLAGIYAVMAFTVSRRTREIGIRIALGAGRWRIVLAVFRRPLLQVALGIAAGTILVMGLAHALSGGHLATKHVAMVLGYSIVMLAVCLLACIVPTRRALAVQPTEALRTDG